MSADASPVETAPARRSVARTVIAGLLVALFAILLPITTVVAWSHRTVLDTGTYIHTIEPIGRDPAVTAAASREITNQIFTALDVPAAVTDALPPKASVLAGPISSGVHDYVQQAVDRVLQSSAFQTLWVEANRYAHKQVVGVLRGDTTALKLTDGNVVINLVPVLNTVLARSQTFVSRVTGHDVVLPTLTGNEVPSVACEQIATALERPVPKTCGVIVLFRAHNLDTARRVVQAFDRGMVALLIVTPLTAIGALLVSQRRRRTLLQLSVAAAVGLVIVRRAVIWGQGQLISGGLPQNRDARAAIVHHLMSGFFDLTLWMAGIALLITAVALVTGPYKWAVSARSGAVVAARAVRVSATGDQRGSGANEAVVWTRDHYELLKYGGIAVAVILIAALNLNVITFLVIAGLLALFEIGLHRLHSLQLRT
jgi:hypothetical protein